MEEVKIAKNTIYKMEYKLDQALTLAENNEQINIFTDVLEKQGFCVAIYQGDTTQDTITITYYKPLNQGEVDVCEIERSFISHYKESKYKDAKTLGSFKKDEKGRDGLELWYYSSDGVDVDILLKEESILGVNCEVERTTYAGDNVYHPIFDSLHK